VSVVANAICYLGPKELSQMSRFQDKKFHSFNTMLRENSSVFVQAAMVKDFFVMEMLKLGVAPT